VAAKHTTTTEKARSPVRLGFIWISGVLSKLKNAINMAVPYGYEDDLGFHYGEEPSKKSTQ
jgi:hypothetical protein